MKTKYLYRRLVNIGLSRLHAYRCKQVIDELIRHKGTKGAFLYLKDVGLTLTAWMAAGCKPVRPHGWVKVRQGFPVKFSFLRGYPLDVLSRFSKVARFYMEPDLTKAQVSKVVDGVTQPYQGDDVFDQVRSLINRGVQGLDIKPFNLSDYEIPWVTREFRTVSSVSGKTKVIHEPQVYDAYQQFMSSPFSKAKGYEAVFLPIIIERIHARNIDITSTGFVGEIHATQEPGGKLRMFAAPFTVYQCCITPIHNWLCTIKDQLSQDCYLEQERGALWAKSRLEGGRRVVSMDLSTATCRFPYAVQRQFLLDLGLPFQEVHLLDFLVTGTWKVGSELQPAFPPTLKWEVGQPLGIVPSMSMFSLTHVALLRGLCFDLGLDPQDSFCVLGDDVVMVGELSESYSAWISKLGIPISWDKSYDSTSFAEFAGYSVTPTSMVRPGKWQYATAKNHIELAKELGKALVGEVSDFFLQLERIVLFSLGLYDPPAAAWTKFVRVASQLGLPSEMKYLPKTRSLHKGIQEVASQQFGFKVQVYPVHIDPNRLLRVIPGITDLEIAYYSAWLSNAIRTGAYVDRGSDFLLHSVNGALSVVESACRNLFNEARLTFDQLCAVYRDALHEVLRALYTPPRAVRESRTGFHYRLRSLYLDSFI